MRKSYLFIVLAVSLLFIFSGAVRAVATTIGFDDLPDGTHVDNQYSGLGVVFTTHWVDSSITRPADPIAHPGYAGQWGLNGIVFDSYCNADEYVQANFSVPVDHVSIEMQPFEAGTYFYGLELYDASNNPMGAARLSGMTAHSAWGAIDPAELVVLSVHTLSPNVAYARFFGYMESGGINSVSFDNFTFEATSVPDGGTTLFLLGSVLMGLEVLRRKQRN